MKHSVSGIGVIAAHNNTVRLTGPSRARQRGTAKGEGAMSVVAGDGSLANSMPVDCGTDARQIRVFVVAKSDFVVDGLLNIMETDDRIRLLSCVEPGENCWRKFREEQPDILLLHADVFTVPANELTGRIKEACPDTGIVVFGWNMSQEFLVGLLTAGVRGYINENMSGAHLVHAVESVSNGRLWVERVVLEEVATEALQMHELMERAILERLDSFRDHLTPRETTVLRHVLEG
ncbi:MAG: hypothetical protein P8124_10340, partial [Gammaproteobacteria bacterium]